ncbi:unnamed protein product, partial [marine sediment metagenome]
TRKGGARVRRLFTTNRLDFVDAAGDTVLLLRDVKEPIKLYETGDFTPERVFREVYNGQLTFLGSDSIPTSAEVGGKLPFCTYWRRVGRIDRYYLTEFTLVDEHGRAVAQLRRYLCYTFYPVHDWRVGDTVRETYNLVIPTNVKPGSYALCLRVLEAKGRKLREARPENPELLKRKGIIRLGRFEVVSPAR